MKDVTNSSRPFKSSSNKGRFIAYLIWLAAMGVYYYLFLPPLNYASFAFWVFLGWLFIGSLVIELLFDTFKQGGIVWQTEGTLFKKKIKIKVENKGTFPKKYPLFLEAFGILVVFYVGVQLICSPLFMADQFAHMIDVQTKDFKEDFPETNVNQIPLIDRDTAILLGNRRLGELSEIVSQFEAASDYTQINIQGRPYRVSPLEYAGFFKWMNNYKEGIPNYIQVDMVSGETQLIDLPEKMKYTNDDLLNRNAKRRLRFKYPFALFGHPSFEVDDTGHPYYVATTYRKRFIFKEPEVNGVVLLDAVSGQTQFYDIKDAPHWIDRVYSSDLILHQLQMNGLYKGGFWNSKFSKTGVTKPTEGYNYLPINNDIYLYTGVTSVVSDASNIGFVLVNMRTKEAKMYPLTAAEEYSAMKSAEGSVQEKGYKATFPLLINLNGQPLYILSLKDQAGLIKQYALIDVANYQNVLIANSVGELIRQYGKAKHITFKEVHDQGELKEIQGQADQIQAVVKDGNTVYYLKIGNVIYQVPIQLNDELPFLVPHTSVKLQVAQDGKVEKMDLLK